MYPRCRYCGERIKFEDYNWVHVPPYLWGSDKFDREILDVKGLPTGWYERNPDWQNGYWCDSEYTTSAEPTDVYKKREAEEYERMRKRYEELAPFLWIDDLSRLS
jgi:hypothetical protein